LLAAGCKTAPKPAPVEPTAPLPEAEYKQAQELRALIEKYSLDQYAPDVYKAADARFQEGEKVYRKDNELSRAALKDAIDGFQKVIDKGFPQVLAGSQKQADASKNAAEDAGAPVAVKSDYAAAMDTYNQAVKASKAKQYEQSLDLFQKAKTQFDGAAKVALQKRDKVEKANQDVLAAKKEADSLKAAVAVKAAYAAALDTYNKALKARDAKDYDSSLDLMQKAKDQFASVAQTARQKKSNAEEAMPTRQPRSRRPRNRRRKRTRPWQEGNNHETKFDDADPGGNCASLVRRNGWCPVASGQSRFQKGPRSAGQGPGRPAGR